MSDSPPVEREAPSGGNGAVALDTAPAPGGSNGHGRPSLPGNGRHPFDSVALAYFQAHAIDPTVAAESGVRQEGDALAFEYRAPDGSRFLRLRSLNGGPKVRQPKGVSLTLWALGADGQEIALLTEGESDSLAALSAMRSAPLEAVRGMAVFAVPGTGMPAAGAVSRLKAAGVRHVYLAFDGDEAGHAYRAKLIPLLQAEGIKPVVLELPDEHDLADVLVTVPADERGEWLASALMDAEAASEEGEASSSVDDPHAWRRLNLAEIIALADERTPWRCHGIAADGYLTVLSGRGGEGKSLLTMGLACGVLNGATIGGFDCERGSVALFDAENGPKLIGRRLKLAGIPHQGLAVFDADGLDLTADADWIAKQLEGIQLAVFDSLRTLAADAKENESDDMAPRLVALRRLARDSGTAIVLVHHRGRESEKDFRGSSAILDQTDLMFVLERDPQDPERHWRRSLRCVKCRIDAEPPPRWFGIRLERGELFFTEAEPFRTERAAPRREETAEDVLAMLGRDGALSRADVAHKLGKSPSDGTLRRAFAELEAAGRIAALGDLWTLATGSAGNPGSPSLPACHPPVGGGLLASGEEQA